MHSVLSMWRTYDMEFLHVVQHFETRFLCERCCADKVFIIIITIIILK